MMAKSSAERKRAWRERQKILLGEEGYKNLRRDEYLRGRQKKQGQETPRATLFEYVKAWCEGRLLRSIAEAKNSEEPSELSETEKWNIELEAEDLYSFLINNRTEFRDWTIGKRKNVTIETAIENEFYKYVDGLLDDEQRDVWDFIYASLVDLSSIGTSWETIKWQIEVGEDVARPALDKLQENEVISYEERTVLKWSGRAEVFECDAVALVNTSCPFTVIIVRRGSKWVDLKPEYVPELPRAIVELWENDKSAVLRRRAERVRKEVEAAKAKGLKFVW